MSTTPSSPVVSASPAPYHPALTARGNYVERRLQRSSDNLSTHHCNWDWVKCAASCFGGSDSCHRQDSIGVMDSTPSPSSSEVTTSTGLDTRIEVVEPLKDILRIRDQAFRDRNTRPLEDVYTIDCPCLEGDRNAIEELVTNNYHVVGGATSIRVHRVEQVSKRLWLVVADFRSAPLRVEAKTES